MLPKSQPFPFTSTYAPYENTKGIKKALRSSCCCVMCSNAVILPWALRAPPATSYRDGLDNLSECLLQQGYVQSTCVYSGNSPLRLTRFVQSRLSHRVPTFLGTSATNRHLESGSYREVATLEKDTTTS